MYINVFTSSTILRPLCKSLFISYLLVDITYQSQHQRTDYSYHCNSHILAALVVTSAGLLALVDAHSPVIATDQTAHISNCFQHGSLSGWLLTGLKTIFKMLCNQKVDIYHSKNFVPKENLLFKLTNFIANR